MKVESSGIPLAEKTSIPYSRMYSGRWYAGMVSYADNTQEERLLIRAQDTIIAFESDGYSGADDIANPDPVYKVFYEIPKGETITFTI